MFGAGFGAFTFLLLVDLIVVDLLGKVLGLESVDDLASLVDLPNFVVGAGCEDVSLSIVGAK